MLAQIANASAWGFGASAGRDAYRKLKKGGVLVFLLVGLFLTTFGYRELVRGHDRGVVGTICLTFLGSVVMILVGTALTAPFGFMAGSVMDAQPTSPGPQTALTVLVVIVVHAVSALVGVCWGLTKRRKWQRARAVAAHNMEFMRNAGFRDLGVGEDVIEDGDGNRLRLQSQNESGITFLAIGRRNVRASIRLDQSGRMTDYTGLVSLA